MKPNCPRCGSSNTNKHSANEIYEEFGIVEMSHRCNKCKSYFYRCYQLHGAPTIHPNTAVLREWIPNPNPNIYRSELRLTLNPERNNPDAKGRWH